MAVLRRAPDLSLSKVDACSGQASHFSHLAPRFRHPFEALIFLSNMANGGEGKMKADYSRARCRKLFEDILADCGCLLRVGINTDRPVGVMEHNDVVMCEVDDMNELIMTGSDMENRMTRRMARRKFCGYALYQFASRLKFVEPGLERQQGVSSPLNIGLPILLVE